MNQKKNLGAWGEREARKYFERSGYQFICNNYRAGQKEIDLIFKHASNYIFIEVKTRTKDATNIDDPFLSAKQSQNLKNAAMHYCYEHHINPEMTRHDLLILLVSNLTRRVDLIHYKNII